MKELLKAVKQLPLMVGFAAVFLAFPVVAQADAPPGPPPAEAPPPPPPPPPPKIMRSISVVGEAQGEYDPDQAVISFAVASHGKVLADTKKNNDEMMGRLQGVTEKFAIPKEKVVASGVFIAPEYDYSRKHERPQVVGYSVTRNMRVTTKDLSKEEELLSALTDIKIDEVNNVQFELSDPQKAGSEVRVRAFADAKAQALALAEAAGAKLGQVVSINTSGAVDMPRPMPMMSMAKMASADAPSVAPSMPGAITVHETVNVTFSLE